MIGNDDDLPPSPRQEVPDASRQANHLIEPVLGHHPTVTVAVGIDLALHRPGTAGRVAEVNAREDLEASFGDELPQEGSGHFPTVSCDNSIETFPTGKPASHWGDRGFG